MQRPAGVLTAGIQRFQVSKQEQAMKDMLYNLLIQFSQRATEFMKQQALGIWREVIDTVTILTFVLCVHHESCQRKAISDTEDEKLAIALQSTLSTNPKYQELSTALNQAWENSSWTRLTWTIRNWKQLVCVARSRRENPFLAADSTSHVTTMHYQANMHGCMQAACSTDVDALQKQILEVPYSRCSSWLISVVTAGCP